MPFGIGACTFSDNLSRNSCILHIVNVCVVKSIRHHRLSHQLFVRNKTDGKELNDIGERMYRYRKKYLEINSVNKYKS